MVCDYCLFDYVIHIMYVGGRVGESEHILAHCFVTVLQIASIRTFFLLVFFDHTFVAIILF